MPSLPPIVWAPLFGGRYRIRPVGLPLAAIAAGLRQEGGYIAAVYAAGNSNHGMARIGLILTHRLPAIGGPHGACLLYTSGWGSIK